MRLEIQSQVCLASHTSLGLPCKAESFVVADTPEQLQLAIRWATQNGVKYLILGGGSNLVFDEIFCGLVIKLAFQRVSFFPCVDGFVRVDVEAGYNFDELIAKAVDRGLWGLENLSWIPGTVGATPIQNVGAFGQSVSNVIDHVYCFDTKNDKFVYLSNAQCQFSHRKSLFNKDRSSRYVVAMVRFKLSVSPRPILGRQQLQSLRDRKESSEVLLKSIRASIIAYRSSGLTLPADEVEGSTGTFFQSPIIEGNFALLTFAIKCFKQLGIRSTIVTLAYLLRHRGPGRIKISSNNLIKQCGLSQAHIGAIKLLETNPSVLLVDKNMSPNVNDFISFVTLILDEVYSKTGLMLPIEPTIVSERMKNIFFKRK